MRQLLTLLLQSITLPVLICWFGFSLWAALWDDHNRWSGIDDHTFAFATLAAKNMDIRLNLWATVVPFLMWQIGWKEYRTQRIEFGCTAHQVYHALHTDVPSWCPASYKTAIDNWDPISLYKPSERVGIWIHHLGESLVYILLSD